MAVGPNGSSGGPADPKVTRIARPDPGRGFLQGSVADRVLSEAHCAVLVAKPASTLAHGEQEQATAHPLSR